MHCALTPTISLFCSLKWYDGPNSEVIIIIIKLKHACRQAHFRFQVDSDHSHSRPVDVLISNWVLGKTAACDLSVTSLLLNSKILSEARVTAGAVAHTTELRKNEANDVKCSDLGWICIPSVAHS